MKQRPRIYYSESQKAMMWDRWRRGESLHDIALLFDRGHLGPPGDTSPTRSGRDNEMRINQALVSGSDCAACHPELRRQIAP
jgi:hypothetical protein